MEQKVLDLIGLLAEDLVHQVIHHVAILATKSSDKLGRCARLLQRKPRHLQSGNPALGMPEQTGNRPLGERQTHRLRQEICRFFR